MSGRDSARGITLAPAVAFIREAECIGCTKCIQACPVDAILGASKLMHTVIAAECTGCELCIEPCPVDCIDMLPLPWHSTAAANDRARRAEQRRLFREQRERVRSPEQADPRVLDAATPRMKSLAERTRMVEEAVARVRARKLAGAGAHRAAVEAAIERARLASLQRAAHAPDTEVSAAAGTSTPEEINRRIAVREKKLMRAREKLAAAETESNSEAATMLKRSIVTHEKLLAELRQELHASQGDESAPAGADGNGR
jgi:Na+-translocating ferredoxin:NAD+ oxidoreductase subunit B